MRRRAAIAVFLVATCVFARRARADDLLDGEHDVGFFRVESFATVGSLPVLALNGNDTSRRLVGAAVPSSGQIWHGIGAALTVRANFVTWDLLSLRYSATGATVSGLSSASDETFHVGVDGWSSVEIGVPLCGIPSGFAAFIGHDNQWKLAFALDAGFDHLWASAETTSSRGRESGASINDWNGYLRVSASTCKKLGRWTGEEDGPVAWFCLTVSPKLVDGNGSSGLSLGGRIEL